MYPALLPPMRTSRLPVVDLTDAPADLNGLVRFAERRNLVSARVSSHFKRSLLRLCLSLRRPTGESNEPTFSSVLTCHVIARVKDGNEAWDRVGCHQPPPARTGDVPCGVAVNWEMARAADSDLSFRKVGSTLHSCGQPATSMRIESRAQIIQEVEIPRSSEALRSVDL